MDDTCSDMTWGPAYSTCCPVFCGICGTTDTDEPEIVYDAPDASLMNSMHKLFERGSDADRFSKIGQRARAILQQKNDGDVLDPAVLQVMQDIKKWTNKDFTEARWTKAYNAFYSIY